MKLYTLITLAALVSTQPLLASGELLEELTVTGTHIPDNTATGRLPKITINADEIAALAPNSFADVLRGLPGVDITEQGGAGGLTFLSVRGGDPNFVVILIDGVKVNDPTNSRGGAFDLGTLDPAIIEKVEIFYGGFSTIYGSDALAGVVSIQTKGATDDGLGTVSVKAGSNELSGGAVNLGLELADFAELSVAGAYQDNDNSSFGDAFRRKELNTSLKSVGQSATRWHISSFYADGQTETFPEDSGGDRLAVIRTPESRDFTQTNLNARLQQRLSEALRLDFHSAWSKREEDLSNPGIAPGVLSGVPAIASLTEYERLDVSAAASYRFSDHASAAMGIAMAEEDGGMDSIIDFGFPAPALYTLKRKTESVFAEAGIDIIAGLQITAATRHDETEQLSVTTSRLIGRYQLGNTSTVSAQYSEGFKLPSFFALGHPFIGNADLKPERSKNYDLSIDSTFLAGKVSTRASIYQNTFTDLVDFDPIAFTNVNRSKVRARGAELSAALTSSERLSFSAQISYNKMKLFGSDAVLRRRPEWKGSLRVNYKPLEVLSLTGRLTLNGDYYDSSIPTGMVEMDGFNRLDMSAVWAVEPDLDLRLNVSNALGGDYEEAIGFKNMGRSITASLAKNF